VIFRGLLKTIFSVRLCRRTHVVPRRHVLMSALAVACPTLLALSLIGGTVPALALDVPPDVLAAERQRIETIESISRSTISVFGVGDAGGGGSAVVITPDGFALTNFHVTKPLGNHLKCGMNDGQLYDAVIVGVDPTGDVALIKLLGRDDFPAAEWGDSDQVRVGDWCIVSGNPLLLATDFHPTITYGIVSGVHRYQYPSGTLLEYADCIQTDAAINPGNSGGPLWNSEGQLIGINGRGSFEKRGRVNVGVGYAISINQIKNFMGYLRSGRIVDHATLGATVSTDETGRVSVTNILESSDAYRRGLRYGDELAAFGGREITSANSFKNALGIFPRGWRVPLSYRRNGERTDVMVRLAGVHAKEELIAKLQLGGIAPPAPKPREKKDDEEPRPVPDRIPAHGGEAKKLPPRIAAVHEERRGYANFYFNRRELDRVWNAFLAFVGTDGVAFDDSPWTITADMPGERAVELVVDESVAKGRIGNEWHEVAFDQSLTNQLSPRGSGGLLLALHQWRRMMVHGPATFGDVYYLGTAPLPGEDLLADVLVATYDVIESRFYFDPQSGALVALEVFPDIDVDPCELRFREYQSHGGKNLPMSVDVDHADRTFASLRIQSLVTSPIDGAPGKGAP
jgi:S1-C subfamily serine protease